MWNFNDLGVYTGFTNTLVNLESTGTYYDGIMSSIQPTINFMYDNFLTNPIIMGLIAVLLVLSLFTFSD